MASDREIFERTELCNLAPRKTTNVLDIEICWLILKKRSTTSKMSIPTQEINAQPSPDRTLFVCWYAGIDVFVLSNTCALR